MEKAAYTANEIADVLGVVVSTVSRKAQKEGWTKIAEPVRGGYQYRYLADLLPDEIKTALALAELKRDGNLLLAVNGVTALVPARTTSRKAVAALTMEQQKNALAKADAVKIYNKWMATAPWGKKDGARYEFEIAWQADSWPVLRGLLGDPAWQTIERWKREIALGADPLSLADRRGKWKSGATLITPEQAKIVLACTLHPNRPRISEAIRMAKKVMTAKDIENGYGESTYRRWIENWKSRNFHIWTFHREGAKAWNDKCAKDIERDYSLINVGDILVADGHTLNFEIINPWTGQSKRMTLIVWKDMKSNFPLGWEIMPTENTAAIGAALRWAIIRLGKMPKVAYLDNGRAFRAKFFEGCPSFEEAGLAGLYERLGMKCIHAWPYHGQAKTVERFFGSFAEMERWCPTYTGTSIEKKPPRMMRNEKLHRQMYERITGGGCLTLEQAHMAIACWFDEYVQRPQSGHLDGQSPLELFRAERGPGVDPAELTWLMMSQEIKHISKNGIRFLKRDYYHPALYGRRHPVLVRYDLQDTSALFVTELSGEFLCVATPGEKCHPAATVLGTDQDRAQLTKQIEFKKRQEKEATASARAFLEESILPVHRQHLAAQGMLPEGTVLALPGNGKVKQLPQAAVQVSDDEWERIQAEAAAQTGGREEDAAAVRRRLAEMTEPDRYEALVEMQVRGMLLTEEWQAFVRYFETTEVYRRAAGYYEDFRARCALSWGVEAKG